MMEVTFPGGVAVEATFHGLAFRLLWPLTCL